MNQGNLFDDPKPCSGCGRMAGHAPGCLEAGKHVEPVAVAPIQFETTKVAIAEAAANADAEWLRVAYEVGVKLARAYRFLTSADIDLAMREAFPLVTTHERRAMGAVTRALMKDKIIEKTDRMISDPRANCHNQNKRIHRSLIWAKK